MSRRTARTYTLQVLYSRDLNPDSESIDSEEYEKMSEKDKEFAHSILQCVKDHSQEIDGMIASHLKNWSMSQLNAVDKNILRLALAEALLDTDHKDTKIILDEAIQLAKTFGGENSYRFVNGLLDAVLGDHK